MAQEGDGGPDKKGFFARRREKKQAKKAARLAPPPRAAAQPKGAALPARPGTAPPRPAPPPRAPEVRVSLESLPEVEKRIDRMSAVERRQRLIERYESKYGERLDLPKVFVPVEEETRSEAAGGATAGGAGKIDEGKLAAVTGMASPKPAAPAMKPPAPAKPGLFGPGPAPPAAARPGPQAPPRPAAAAPPRPAAPVEAKPPAPAPKLPEGMTMGKYLFPQLWPFWGMPLYKFARFRWPDKRNILIGAAVADIPLLVILFIPRLLGIFWAGLAITLFKRMKQKKAAAAEAAAQEAPAAN